MGSFLTYEKECETKENSDQPVDNVFSEQRKMQQEIEDFIAYKEKQSDDEMRELISNGEIDTLMGMLTSEN